jgi:hypothetical protein
MSPATRFHSISVMLTVSLMWLALSYLLKWVGPLTEKAAILGAFVSLSASVGVYTGLTSIISWLIAQFEFVKKLVLGPLYLHGTWAGYLVDETKKVSYFINRFEQDIEILHIKGDSYDENGKILASWNSVAARIDVATGTLTYAALIQHQTKHIQFYNLNVYDFYRSSQKTPPEELRGHVTNVGASERSERINVIQRWVSANLADNKALDLAKRMAQESALEAAPQSTHFSSPSG